MFRVKVDEDLPAPASALLRYAGYDTASVTEQAMGGLKDPPLWEAIQSEERFLITGDKGFGDIRSYPPGTHGGVLVLRPKDDGIRPILELLELVLSEYRLEELEGVLAVATPRGVRIRRQPDEHSR